jgi:hypothetical protein
MRGRVTASTYEEVAVTTTRTRDCKVEDRCANLRRAAWSAGLDLPGSYVTRVVHDAGPRVGVGVSRLGTGLVIHTIPPNKRSLPILLGYADARGQWYRDGKRHIESAPPETAIESEAVAL